MNGAPHLTREQRIVECLAKRLPPDLAGLEPLESRAQALPAMLRRHGPVQVLLFLAGKGSRKENGNGGAGSPDRELALRLVEGIAAGLDTGDELAQAAAARAPGADDEEGTSSLAGYAEWLARQDLAAYLLRWEVAVETAGWLKMLIVARIEEAKARAATATAAAGETETPPGEVRP